MKHRDHTNGLLGYHDSDRCIFDLWSPYDPHHPHLDHERDDCAQENRDRQKAGTVKAGS